MTDRKRLTDGDSRRLRGYVDELLEISGAIAQCSFPHKKPRTRTASDSNNTSIDGTLPVRTLSAVPRTTTQPSTDRSSSNTSRTQQQQQQQQQQKPHRTLSTTREPPRTLFSVVSATAIAAKATSSSVHVAAHRDAWRHTLLETAQALAPSDADRAHCLLRRVDALTASIEKLTDQNGRLSSESAINDCVDAQLEADERAWEQQMRVREQRVAALEVEWNALRESDRPDDDESRSEDDDDDDERDEAEDTSTAANDALREALALRMEEAHDVKAALASLKRRYQQQVQQTRVSSSDAVSLDAPQALVAQLETLRSTKDALQRTIIALEEEHEASDVYRNDLPLLHAAIADRKQQQQRAQEELERAKHSLVRLKARLKHMVDVQLLTANDTTPPTLKEEAVILHLLYDHAGEMDMDELKHAAAAVLAAAHGTARDRSNGGGGRSIVQALYSLVANNLVTIDRSGGTGVVTSLLV